MKEVIDLEYIENLIEELKTHTINDLSVNPIELAINDRKRAVFEARSITAFLSRYIELSFFAIKSYTNWFESRDENKEYFKTHKVIIKENLDACKFHHKKLNDILKIFGEELVLSEKLNINKYLKDMKKANFDISSDEFKELDNSVEKAYKILNPLN